MDTYYIDAIRVDQAVTYYCGPACAYMYVGYALKATGSTAATPSQPTLWDYIVAHSPSTQPNGVLPVPVPSYKNQHCDNCGVNSQTGLTKWSCWSTSPEGLETVIDAFAPSTYGVAVNYPGLRSDGVNLIMGALLGTPRLPAIVSTNSINHWCVVNGYMRDNTALSEFPLMQLGNYRINFFYLLDPDPLAANADGFTMVSAADFNSRYGSITCGANSGNYPTLVPDHKPVTLQRKWWFWLVAISVSAFLLWYLKNRR